MSKKTFDNQEAEITAQMDVSNEAKNSKTGFKTTMSAGTYHAGDSYHRNK